MWEPSFNPCSWDSSFQGVLTFKNLIMKVSVWDTYVERRDGKTMHFDILVPSELKNEQTIYGYGKEYL